MSENYMLIDKNNIENRLHINGLKYFFKPNLSILELMEYLGFNKNVIVIDYNGIILDKIL